MDQSNEIWKPVVGYEGIYEVSDQGRMRSLDRTVLHKDGRKTRRPGMVLVANPNSLGYPRVSLCKDGDSHWSTLHAIVAQTFLPKPPRKIGATRRDFVVNHKDGNKLNNHVSNLEYITSTANIYHARATGLLSVKGVKNNKAKLSDDDVRSIRELYSLGATQVQLAAEFGVYQTSISRIVRRDGWKHVV